MKFSPRLFLLILLPLLMSFSDANQQLRDSLRLSKLPKSLNIKQHLDSAMGPDRFQLWQLNPLTDSAFKKLLHQAKASSVAQRSMSGCLGLEGSDSAPTWWPSKELEDAMWDYTSSPYELYVAKPTARDRVCIYRHSKTKIIFIQSF
jgi:hypothetical protein